MYTYSSAMSNQTGSNVIPDTKRRKIEGGVVTSANTQQSSLLHNDEEKESKSLSCLFFLSPNNRRYFEAGTEADDNDVQDGRRLIEDLDGQKRRIADRHVVCLKALPNLFMVTFRDYNKVYHRIQIIGNHSNLDQSSWITVGLEQRISGQTRLKNLYFELNEMKMLVENGYASYKSTHLDKTSSLLEEPDNEFFKENWLLAKKKKNAAKRTCKICLQKRYKFVRLPCMALICNRCYGKCNRCPFDNEPYHLIATKIDFKTDVYEEIKHA